MKKLTKQPTGKYYTRIVNGGLNGAVLGKPTIAGANVLCNCVGFANGRFNQIINDPNLNGVNKAFKYQLVCNAENFIESAKKQGLKISSTPTLGGIMVWQKGATLGGGDGAGHVAVVEEIYSDGTIMTSESGWNAWAFKNIKRSNSNGRWGQSSAYKFRGCIVNPSVKSTITPVKESKLVVDGIGGEATVRAMQRFFGTTKDGIISGQNSTLMKKYCPSLKSYKSGKGGSPCVKKLQKWVGANEDGVIGQITVKLWQKKIGVSPQDGIFGVNSMKAWQRYLNEHDKAVYPEKSIGDKIMDACKAQSVWMKDAAYKWEQKPTIEKSKKRGTCVTYVACVLQRLGYLQPGQYVWQNGKGYGTGKVVGANDKMDVKYMNNKSLTSLKDQLKKGDIILLDDNKSGEKGSGGHIMILTGDWTSAGNPYIWDQETAKKGQKARAYSGKRKVLARIRLK